MAEDNWKIGSTVWIEHKDTGDIYYKVRLVLEHPPGEREFCRVCRKGQVSLLGHLIQTGILDDKVYAVTVCRECCAVTVFVYHVEAQSFLLPQEGNCNDK